jgi:hypothetical protein
VTTIWSFEEVSTDRVARIIREKNSDFALDMFGRNDIRRGGFDLYWFCELPLDIWVVVVDCVMRNLL